ncbi:hypothetical protein An17g00360 [Aspergillus niger]|uniref:Uncharacterized protein n=2 Tax=Aspergillus niger TaxID=5061 RepID=A2R973_ASPNC|nr:hypothetical protein An17g00360 [Aspergillus niger]CAK97396.1 hypothetical protein An17g00360 [Aspergillus niger]
MRIAADKHTILNANLTTEYKESEYYNDSDNYGCSVTNGGRGKEGKLKLKVAWWQTAPKPRPKDSTDKKENYTSLILKANNGTSRAVAGRNIMGIVWDWAGVGRFRGTEIDWLKGVTDDTLQLIDRAFQHPMNYSLIREKYCRYYYDHHQQEGVQLIGKNTAGLTNEDELATAGQGVRVSSNDTIVRKIEEFSDLGSNDASPQQPLVLVERKVPEGRPDRRTESPRRAPQNSLAPYGTGTAGQLQGIFRQIWADPGIFRQEPAPFGIGPPPPSLPALFLSPSPFPPPPSTSSFLSR